MAKNKKKDKGEAGQTPASASPADRPAPKIPKRKTPAERRRAQIEGIKKTLYAALLGVAAGVICFYFLGDGTNIVFREAKLEWHFILMNLLLITYLVQKAVYPFLGINVAEFKTKDWLYVEFIAVDLWAVTWTVLLN
ncbi:MAG: hypothetical protein A4E45_00474 [Methanosaeta sp. PtaB.Bin039]|nr:MAG: hypothetical protein A4E45_00474 [Methanosaeta sp. PtaB.Bin039]OPY46141.1 MAG: hypothetical protein A4E47_00701 [Methanosaeta sp. PtaU1.Bin028]HOT07208.1 hypothetical protein [Methanotrichaceae archaeon]HQF17187.1 hypothetical protein [Methanotrichaceae archaeon]HQI91760.1 hypothetical protein [Methanotrichaceae archaeon]